MKNLADFQLMIFDLDGTLIDSKDDLCYSIKLLRDYYQLKPIKSKKIASFIGHGVDQLVKKSLSDAINISLNEALNKFIQIYQKNMFKKTKIFKGFEQVISFFSRTQIHRAILSNKMQSLLNQCTQSLELNQYFPIILGPETVPKKPSPKGIIKILDFFNVKKSNCLMIGDGYADILAAQNAQVHSCLLKNNNSSFQNLNEIDFVFQDLNEFSSHLIN